MAKSPNSKSSDHEDYALFWSQASEIEKQDDVTRGTMMGFPCLRTNGDFFASVDPKAQFLIVKRSAADVKDIVRTGGGEPFAPAGRVFKEWVAVPEALSDLWPQHIANAHAFVVANPKKKTKPKKKTA